MFCVSDIRQPSEYCVLYILLFCVHNTSTPTSIYFALLLYIWSPCSFLWTYQLPGGHLQYSPLIFVCHPHIWRICRVMLDLSRWLTLPLVLFPSIYSPAEKRAVLTRGAHSVNIIDGANTFPSCKAHYGPLSANPNSPPLAPRRPFDFWSHCLILVYKFA